MLRRIRTTTRITHRMKIRLDGNENKNNTDGSQVPAGDNNGTAPDTNTDMNNDGTDGTNNNMNGATSGDRYGG